MKDHFDVIVIGGGPGGYEAALKCAEKGKKTAIVEKSEYGGTCTNWGCIPTKALLESAHLLEGIKNCKQYGINVESLSFDITKIHGRKKRVVTKFRKGVELLLRDQGVAMYQGCASFVDAETIIVKHDIGSTEIIGDHIIIATGAVPVLPPIPGMYGTNILTSKDILKMDERVPESLIIMGGGVIGLEFADFYSSLGVKVSLVEMADRILPFADSDISQAIGKRLAKKKVKIYTSARVTEITGDTRKTLSITKKDSSMELEAEYLLVAAGRKGNIQDLGLENIGIDVENSFITVNEYMTTSHPSISAIGDVNGGIQLAHVASREALIAAAHITGDDPEGWEMKTVPSCIYTHPEIAFAGLTEEDAALRGIDAVIGMYKMNTNPRSTIINELDGFIKIVAEKASGKILGAHLFTERASDMISEITFAMDNNLTVNDIAKMIHPHPGFSEGIQAAAELCGRRMAGAV